jgi:hypothetical protein
MVPCLGWSPAVLRYLRIQSNTNPFLKEVCRQTSGRVMASFLPIEGPFQDILKDTVYECVENRTILLEFVAKQLLLQCISHEINDGVHEVVKKITHH